MSSLSTGCPPLPLFFLILPYCSYFFLLEFPTLLLNFFFFLNDPPPAEFYLLPLPDALPIGAGPSASMVRPGPPRPDCRRALATSLTASSVTPTVEGAPRAIGAHHARCPGPGGRSARAVAGRGSVGREASCLRREP